MGTSADGTPLRPRRQRDPVKPLPDFVDLIASLENDGEKEQVTTELFALAQEIWELVEAKRRNRGVLPRGTLPSVAHRLGFSTDQIWRLVDRMDRHDRDRTARKQVGPRANAVIKGQRGRQKGKRDCPEHVQQFIIDAWRNPDWESRNHLGLVDPIHRHISKSWIYRLVTRKFPELRISERTVRRIIDDFEMNNGAKAAYGRGKEGEAKEHLTCIDADFGDPNNVWIADIRPLPIKSMYKSIECTVGLLLIMDGSSTNVLRHKLLPRKDEDEEGNVFGVDFTCQHVRIQLVLAILAVGRRPRHLYVDNGSQFGKALQKFLDLLTAEGEEPIQIHHTRPGEPQGRGVIERALALIDDFIQFKPGFFPEDSYRKSLKNKKKYKSYEFPFLEAEFDHFIPTRNAMPTKKDLAPAIRYEQGPDQGLTPPSLLLLGLFAGSAQRIKDRIPSREGIRYDNKHFALVDEDPELAVKLAGFSLNHQQRPTFVITFETLVVLYVKLDDRQWVLFIEKKKRQWSMKKQRAWKDAVGKYLEDDQRGAEARIQMTLIDDIGKRLIIDSFDQDFSPYEEPGTGQASDSTTEEAGQATRKSKPTRKGGTQQNQPSSRSHKSEQDDDTSTRKKSSSSAPQGSRHQDLSRMRGDEEEDESDDIPNFMIQRMQDLQARTQKEG